MHQVDLFIGGKTNVWVSDKVAKAILEFTKKKDNPKGFTLGKLEFYAKARFKDYEGDDKPIRNEGGGVFRIGLRRNLFRVIGFYEDGSGRNFIAIDTIHKRGQKLSKADQKTIERVAKVKAEHQWRKKGKSN